MRPIPNVMEPSLRERLSLRALVDAPSGDDRAVMARALAWMFFVAATLGFLALVFVPADYGLNFGANAVILGAAYAVVAGVVIAWDRMPRWMYPLALAGGTLSTSLGIYFNGPRPQDNELFYLWVVLYAFYFFPFRQALAQFAFIAASYATVLVVLGAGSAGVARWLITTGTLALAGVLVALLKRRVERLLAGMASAARTDELTNLLNRRGFAEEYARELERARRSGRALSVLVGDLDHFKQLNDRLGHQAGDEGLVRVSRTLETEMRLIDVAARMGGEEFALIAPESDAHGAYGLAERLRTAVAREFGDDQVQLTISFGIATYPDHGEDARTLMRHADQALYAAKELGRNRSVIHSGEVERVLAGAAERQAERLETNLATALNLAEAIDMRDAGTAEHSVTVGRYAEAMARELGLSPARVERVRLAGVLHDVGKIGVPDSVLQKPGRLDEDEWQQMRRHPEIGARILQNAGLDDIRAWVLAHHERIDGGGYPHGLPAEQIPLEARILAVADAYEAMTSDRVYRKSLEPHAAREELLRSAGSQFDPQVVQAFLRALERSGERSAA